jgi:predicted nucleic acid-binding protein
MRIFLDANVVFSACNRGSNLATLVDAVVQRHSVVTSVFALEEARRNIVSKRPDWVDDLKALAQLLEIVPSTLFVLPVELEEIDRPILCAAIHSRCDLLATGDRKHFGHLFDQDVEGVTIVTPLGLAERLFGPGNPPTP